MRQKKDNERKQFNAINRKKDSMINLSFKTRKQKNIYPVREMQSID